MSVPVLSSLTASNSRCNVRVNQYLLSSTQQLCLSVQRYLNIVTDAQCESKKSPPPRFSVITSPARDSVGARYCNQFVHNVHKVLNSCEFAPTINSRRQMAGSPPNLHMVDSRSACVQGVLKVKVNFKGHVVRAGRKIASSSTQMTGSRRQVCNLTFLPFQQRSPRGSTTAGEVCYL